MNDKLEQYKAMFNDQFPLMCCMDMSDEDIIAIIDDCLANEKPYQPYLGNDYVY